VTVSVAVRLGLDPGGAVPSRPPERQIDLKMAEGEGLEPPRALRPQRWIQAATDADDSYITHIPVDLGSAAPCRGQCRKPLKKLAFHTNGPEGVCDYRPER
jgi:hypothetical protein